MCRCLQAFKSAPSSKMKWSDSLGCLLLKRQRTIAVHAARQGEESVLQLRHQKTLWKWNSFWYPRDVISGREVQLTGSYYAVVPALSVVLPLPHCPGFIVWYNNGWHLWKRVNQSWMMNRKNMDEKQEQIWKNCNQSSRSSCSVFFEWQFSI